MNRSRNESSAYEEASHWWVRLDAGDLGDAERAAFDAWRRASPENDPAFTEVCRLWGELDALRPGLSRTSTHRKSRSLRRWAVAAAIAVVVIIGQSTAIQADLTTGSGEIKRIALADGSTLILNSESRVAVRFTTAQRRIELIDGEAWFEVAKDANRPFVVGAGKGTATALGTIFDIRAREGEVQVTVVESRVAVDYTSAGAAAHWELQAGQATHYSDVRGPDAVHKQDLDVATAWRRGRLVFENRPLADVIAELNHYHKGYIAVVGETVRNRWVSGVFRTDHPVEVVASLERSLGLHSTRMTERFILLHQ